MKLLEQEQVARHGTAELQKNFQDHQHMIRFYVGNLHQRGDRRHDSDQQTGTLTGQQKGHGMDELSEAQHMGGKNVNAQRWYFQASSRKRDESYWKLNNKYKL